MSLRALLRIKIFLLLPSLHWDKITSKSWQKHQFLFNFYQVIPPTELLQKNPPKKFLQKNSSKKISPKKFLPKNSQKFFLKNSSKNSLKKSLKNCKQFLNKFLRFWKYPIPFIALGGQKPFWACFCRNFKSLS